MKPVTKTLAALIALAMGALPALSAAPSAKPNIIFILADDLGLGDIATTGGDNYKTPHIDALAKGGTLYSNAYALPLCGPSRVSILTGRYPFRTGGTNQDACARFTPAQETMTPKVLKSAGYVSSMIGKWGQLPLTPDAFGFDDYLEYTGSGIFWNTQKKGKDYLLNGVTTPLLDKQYMPDVMHDHLVDFISKNRDKPFYVYYSLSHVHTEILPTPDSTPGSTTLYADNVAYMDKLVGKLVAELERLKLREKTLVVFYGANGSTEFQTPTSTIGGRALNGAKGSMLEGGSHVPLIVNWPGVTPAGKVSTDLIEATDFFSTFAELAGAEPSANTILDSRSFSAQIRGEKGTPRDWIYVQLARMWYVLEPGWKLNHLGELYDLSDAPFSEKLVSASTQDAAPIAARARLQDALDKLNPAGGILDDGDGTGRHASRAKKNAKKDEE